MKMFLRRNKDKDEIFGMMKKLKKKWKHKITREREREREKERERESLCLFIWKEIKMRK